MKTIIKKNDELTFEENVVFFHSDKTDSKNLFLSDEEVNHEEQNTKLYYVKYRIQDSNETIEIATTRPETIMADAAICVNPKDERYVHLKGKKVFIPLLN